MQQHFAEDIPFVSKSNALAGAQQTFIARRAESYAISVDTMGKLRWQSGDLDGDHLICVVSERAPDSIERRDKDALWIRYEVVRSSSR
jgi:2,5-diamino-6-(ribosylamino)-4(3H)-pyrimidinone 5'-phosphate reductase